MNSTPALVAAASGIRPAIAPVWFMRQAGRCLPEYKEARGSTQMLDACLTPELAAEITLQPVRRHGVDAAIFFSDIVVPLKLAGIDVEIRPGVGPVMGKAHRTAADIAELTAHEPGDHTAIREAIAITLEGLSKLPTTDVTGASMLGVPLIGFAGAPFTLAAYLVEGKPSRDHLAARTLMHAEPELWDRLMTWTADITGRFLAEQVAAGASVVQLFDSWAGSLSRADYVERVLPYSLRALEFVDVPKIHFGTGTGEFLADMEADVTGVDYRIPLDDAVARIASGRGLSPDQVSVQGNIDPALLAAPFEVLAEHTRAVLNAGKVARSHIVNLGHGVPPTTDPTVLTRLAEFIHEESK